MQRKGRYPLRHLTSDVIGVDECGTGAWAGPIAVCAAYVPPGVSIPDLNDSKTFGNGQAARAARARVSLDLRSTPGVWFCLEMVSAVEITTHGQGVVYAAAMARVANALHKHLGRQIIFDGSHAFHPAGQAVPRADGAFPSVAAASIIAKDYRDTMMIELGAKYPGYAFEQSMGYGTPSHRAGLAVQGPCILHRMNIEKVRSCMR